MNLIQKIKSRLVYFLSRNDKALLPATAYNIWAATYDLQTDNPLIFLDEITFETLIHDLNFEGKIVVDIGCGTGRHWRKILKQNPAQIIGYDASEEMLKLLQKKFPNATTHITTDGNLRELGDESCDIIFSNLTIGYIENIQELFREWNRVLKKNGEIIITDFHPEALQKGAQRIFKHNNKNITIKNHIHSLDTIKAILKTMNMQELRIIEQRVDNRIKHFYIKYSSLSAYNNSLNELLLYGLHVRKNVGEG